MSRRGRIAIVAAVAVFLFVGVLSFLSAQNTHAAASNDSINKISLRNQVPDTCYTYTEMNSTFEGSSNPLNSIFKGTQSNVVILADNTAGYSLLTCRKAFENVSSLYGVDLTPDSLGYQRVESDQGDNGPVVKCIYFSYSWGTNSLTSKRICFAVRDGKIEVGGESPKYKNGTGNNFSGVVNAINVGFNNSNQSSGSLTFSGGSDTYTVSYSTGLSWDEFVTNYTYGANRFNGKSLKLYVNGKNETYSIGNISVNSNDSESDSSAHVSYEFWDGGNISSGKQHMIQTLFKNAGSGTIIGSNYDYVLDKAYASALARGHISESSDCKDSKEAAKATTGYAHYNSSTNKWCSVAINTSSSMSNYKYALVSSNKKYLQLQDVKAVLEAQTNRNLGNTTTADACSSAATTRLAELRTARDAEYNTNGNTELYTYLSSAYNQLSGMITRNELVSANGSCAELPSVDPGTETQKTACATVFTTAITQLQGIINSSSAETSEKYDAQTKLNKINDLDGKYWKEGNNGEIICLTLAEVYGEYTPPPSPGGDEPGSDTPGQDAEDPCYDAGATLGWIICPVIDVAGKALVGIYDNVIHPFLEIKSEWLQSGSDGGVYGGWKQFRDIANIIFAIAFAVVILAQVTGIGISNYNIKKILPRLIMVVVLVNVSFVICQLATDISNIAGQGLQNMFSSMADNVDPSRSPVEIYGSTSGETAPWFSLGGFASTILTVLAVGGLIYGLAVSWEFWLIPFLLAILGCVVGVIFFFIILGVRQAGVLILTALAPVAIVCYALPNTKSLFDKWLKMYQALLLVFPICGALIGGGQFASALLISAGGGENFFYDLVAMLVQVVPFFFIPSILKSSMAAMGNLGMKISSFGQRFGSGATRAIGNSEGVREARRSLDMHNAERSFNRLNRRAAKLEQSGRKLSRRQMRARGNAAARYNRLAYEDFRAGGRQELLSPGSSMWERETAKQFEEDVAGKQELLRSGKIGSLVNSGETVNGNDDAALEAELGTYIDKIIAGTGTTQEQDNYVKSAQAIANTLSDRGTGSARARVVNSLASAINRNQSTLTAAMGTSDAAKANRQRLGTTLGSVVGRLNSKYGKAYKGDNPEAIKMFNDIAQADFSRAGSFTRTVQDRDIDGNVTGTHLRSTQYAGAGLDGMSEEDFSKLKTSGLSNILDGIQTGDIKGARLQEAARLADRVLNSDVYTPDADARQYMEQIRDAAFASTHDASGASAVRSASSSAIDSIVSRLQASGAWSSLTPTQQTELSGLASNVKTALETGTFTSGDAQQLQQALRIAHNNGIEVGGSVISDTPSTPPTLKIDRNAPQPMVKSPVPAGFTEAGIWVGGGAGPTPQQQIAYNEWAKHSAKVDRHNSSLGGGGGTP